MDPVCILVSDTDFDADDKTTPVVDTLLACIRGASRNTEGEMTGCVQKYIDSIVQYCSNSSALAVELLQSCTKPSVCCWSYTFTYSGVCEYMEFSFVQFIIY